jgi:O-antigen/teichoic acid export membrane protein
MHRSFLLFLLPAVTTGLVGLFVMVPITTYYLEPRDFGVVAFLAALLAPFGPLSSAGAPWVVGGNYFHINAEARRSLLFHVLLVDLVLKGVVLLALWLSAPLALPFLMPDFEARHIDFFRIMLAATLCSGFWPTISYLLVVQRRAGLHAVIEICQYLAGALTTVVCLATLGLTTVSLVLGNFAAALALFCFCAVYAARQVRPSLDRAWLREIAVRGTPSIPANLSEMVASVSDRYFLGRWSGLDQLGIYSHSLQYRTAFAAGSKAFGRTFGPAALEAYAAGKSLPKLTGLLRPWYGVCAAGGVLVTLFSEDAVRLLTHDKFTAAAPLVPIWFGLVLSFALGTPYSQFLVATKRSRWVAWASMVSSGFAVALAAVGTWFLGAVGAALAVVGSNLALQLIFRRHALRFGCAPVGEAWFVAAVAATVAAYAVTYWLGAGLTARVLTAVLAVPALVAAFGVARGLAEMREATIKGALKQ